MKEKIKESWNREKGKWILSILWIASILVNLAARASEEFAEWYVITIYPVFVWVLGHIFSLFPFSVMEFAGYTITAAVLVLAAVGIWKMAAGRAGFPNLFWKGLSWFIWIAIFILTLENFLCGVNYHRYEFSKVAGFSANPSTKEALLTLCEFLTEEINKDEPFLETNQDGTAKKPDHVGQEATALMRRLGETYPCLSGYYPQPKALWRSELLSMQNLEGLFCSFTIEANYNDEIPEYKQAVVICHELSHLKGFMREDEANFIAYLACRQSENPLFRYSGNMQAYVYATNALYKIDPKACREIRDRLCDQARYDLDNYNAYWKKYHSVVSEVSDKVNDIYLKVNSQADGVKSYGRVVDLLINYLGFSE